MSRCESACVRCVRAAIRSTWRLMRLLTLKLVGLRRIRGRGARAPEVVNR